MSLLSKLAVVAARQMASSARSAGTSEILRALTTPAAPAKPAPPPLPVGFTPFVRLIHAGFFLCIGLTVAVIFGVLMIDSNALWFSLLRIGMAAVLLAEGAVLLSDWRNGRRLLVAHFRSRRPPTGLGGGLLWRSAGFGFAVAGFTWVVMGIFAVVVGVSSLAA